MASTLLNLELVPGYLVVLGEAIPNGWTSATLVSALMAGVTVALPGAYMGTATLTTFLVR